MKNSDGKNKGKTTRKTKDLIITDNKYYFYRSLFWIFIGTISFIFDNVIVKVANAVQYPLLFEFFYSITLLGEVYIFIWIVLIIIATLLIYRKPITTAILTTAFAGIVSWSLKSIVGRPRPFEIENITGRVSTTFSSFPSGHTLLFFSIVPIISKSFPKLKIWIWTIAVLIGLSRIYLGVHYFSDVVCGAIIGYTIGWAFLKIGEKHAWKY